MTDEEARPRGPFRDCMNEGPVKQTFLRIERFTSGLAMAGACAMLVVASSLGMFQIVTRFVLEQPAEWSEILIRLSLIWMVFLGIPLAFRQGAMVSVDVLYRWSPPKLRRVLDWAVAARLAAADRHHPVVGLGLRRARPGADHGRPGVDLDVLGLPGAAGGRPLLHPRHHRQPADPQRNELERR